MLFYFQSEKEWLEQKRKDVTSTEVAALFGLNPYKSRLRLWYEKANIVPDEFEENPLSLWGRRLQLPVGLGVCEDEGWQGFDLTGYYLHDPLINSGASLDMKAICPERGKINLEIKTAENLNESDGWTKKSAPIHYEFQMQMQMHEALKHGDPFDCSCLAVLERRQRTRLYFREYDSELGQIIDNEIKGFWESIKADNPPPPDYAVDGALLERISKPVRAGESKNLSLDNRAVALMSEWQNLSSQEKELKEKINTVISKKNEIKSEIHDKIGNAETIIIGDFIISAKEQLNDERFVSAHKFRRFDVKKRKGN